jgi:hypothetical protein
MLGFASARAQALQSEIGAMVEARYGIDVRERFIRAADDSTRNLGGPRSASQEFARRIKRLRDIISDVRRGRIKCR